MSLFGKTKRQIEIDKNTAENTALDIVKSRSLWHDAFNRFKKNKASMVSVYILIGLIIFITVVPFIINWSYEDIDWDSVASPPSMIHIFGTDENGRDILARIAFGGKISLSIGILGAFVIIVIGTIYGAISGYTGGWVDSIMMRIVEILDALPFMFVVILMLTLFGRNIFLVFIAIGMVSWIGIARVVRGITLSIKNKEFIEAALVIGSSKSRIIFKHIVPNLIGFVVIYSSMYVPSIIMFESFLSFLGIGIQEPLSSWGSLISDGKDSIQSSPWMLIFPSIFLAVTLFCSNYIGDGLRDALDPKDR